MKKILLISFFLSTNGMLQAQAVYNFSIPKIEGGNLTLSIYQGKKIMIIALPVQQDASADSLLFSLDTLAAAHNATLGVIAVPSYEAGYSNVQKTQLEQWYRSKLGNNVVVTEGLYISKNSGSQQNALFSWLTHVDENQIFDIDAEQGSKYFINEEGSLNTVLRPQTKIISRSVQKALSLTSNE